MFQQMRTRLTAEFGLAVPLVSAPTRRSAAVAVSQAGALGLVNGHSEHGLDEPFAAPGHAQVGISFNSGSLVHQPELLQQALEQKPKAIMLSSGDHLAKFAPAVKAAGIPLICKCATLDCVKKALQAGATCIVTQSAAGRASLVALSFVATVADYLKAHSPETLLLAAGGNADGSGVAAALMMGADGALIDPGFWATSYLGRGHSSYRAEQQASTFNLGTLTATSRRELPELLFTGVPPKELRDAAGFASDSPLARTMVGSIMHEASERLSGVGSPPRSSL